MLLLWIGGDLRARKIFDRFLGKQAVKTIAQNSGSKMAGPTRAETRKITNTRWLVKMMRKYHVASSVMVSQIVLTPSPRTLDLLAKKRINENTRKSVVRKAVMG